MLLLLLSALLACKGPDTELLECGDSEDRVAGVITGLYFGRRDGDVTVGFDLDDHVSDAGDDESCGNADLVHPDGTEGIDSAFSGLVPALEATEAQAVEGLIQDSIANGQLLLVVELSKVDDPWNDDCVDVGIHRAEGAPLLGTDGRVLDNQTFQESSSVAPALMFDAPLVDGAVTAGPFEMALPLQILDVALEFTITDGQIFIQRDEYGGFTGYFAGAVPLEQILAIVSENDLGDIRDLVTNLVSLAADMHPDENGDCQALSIVFEFEGAPAYLNHD
ncbi:MAG: hypothetical protein H6741_11690 [Alphaproteobacteria bacterium]|nr:hypothetical protein [Alphaproteobacteria bacterium]MCB9793373.1 hypothetical protein [Alphaproteobacteria bacterium]